MSNKLARYNQKLLAILGTLAVAGLAILLLFLGYLLVDDLLRDRRRSRVSDNALAVTETKDTVSGAPEIKKQEISFLTPKLIDTFNSIYLIPVSQVNLEQPEVIEDDRIFSSSSSYGKKSYSSYRYSGSYNNIILYHQASKEKTPAFNTKVNIVSFENHFIEDKHYLLIDGVTRDSNRDGKLNGDDLQSFFVYCIDDDKLETIQVDNMGLIDHYLFHDTDEIVLKFGKDKNHNGRLDTYTEPSCLRVYKIGEKHLDDLVGDELTKQLQELIQ